MEENSAANPRRPLRALISFTTGAYALALLVLVVLRLVLGDSLWWIAFLGNFMPIYFAALLVLLPLALVARAKRGLLLMLPLAVLGLVWFGRLYLPKAQADAGDAPTLRVITFNVLGDNPQRSDVVAWVNAQDADIVMIQETPPVWANPTFSEVAEQYPFQANQSAELRYWGNSTWSRLPIVSFDNFDLEGDGSPTHSRTVVEVDGQQVAIYNIHLFLPLSDTPQIPMPVFVPYLNVLLRYNETVRNQQIERLKDVVKDETLPYVVAGDFNLSDQSSHYDELAAIMRDSFREAGTGLGTSWPMLQARGLPPMVPPLVRIDYIWHSADFQAVSVEQGPYLGSDHLPLMATLALR